MKSLAAKKSSNSNSNTNDSKQAEQQPTKSERGETREMNPNEDEDQMKVYKWTGEKQTKKNLCDFFFRRNKQEAKLKHFNK